MLNTDGTFGKQFVFQVSYSILSLKVESGIHILLVIIINAIIFFSNMPINSTKQYGEDGLLQDTFEKSIKMSTYLVAFMIMDFTSRSTTTSSNVLVSNEYFNLH